MAWLHWISSHRYQARRPGDGVILGTFRLGPKNQDGRQGYVFDAEKVILREIDMTGLQQKFVELNRNLAIEERRDKKGVCDG